MFIATIRIGLLRRLLALAVFLCLAFFALFRAPDGAPALSAATAQGTPLPVIMYHSLLRDPAMAGPYTAPQGTRGMYQTGECCTEEGHVWRCTQANTVYPPSQLPGSWEDLGEVSG